MLEISPPRLVSNGKDKQHAQAESRHRPVHGPSVQASKDTTVVDMAFTYGGSIRV